MRVSNESVKQISIVIPHYNGFEKLRRCIDSVYSSRGVDVEIIVVDDSSTDASRQLIRQEFPSLILIENESNMGYGHSCNAGFNASHGQYVLYLNNDAVIDPDCIANLLEGITHYGAKLATPKMLYYSDHNVVNAEGGTCDRFGVGINDGNGSIDKRDAVGPRYVFYGSACLMVERKLMEKLRGFDESYYMYSEDVDLCWRAQLLGFKTLYVPSGIVYHDWRGTTVKSSFVTTYVSRNSLKTVLKNYSTRTILSILPAYAIMKIVELIYFAFRSREMARNILSGLRWNMTHLTETMVSRKAVQSSRKVTDKEVVKMMGTLSFEVKLLLGSLKNPIINNIVEMEEGQELKVVLRE